MVTNIQQAVVPLLLICSVFGMGVYSPKKRYLNILYNLTVWVSYVYLCYYVVTTFKAEIWFIRSISNLVNIETGVFVTITSVIMIVYRDKKFRLLMKRLDAVDDTLEELGTSKIYQKLYTYAKGMLIVWLMCSYTANACDMTWWFHAMEDHRCMIIPYITNHYHHINILMDLLIILFLWYIGTRFDKVNEHMRCLIVKKGLRYWRKTISTTHPYIMCTDYKHFLWTSIHLHLELCQIARELNKIFGPHMTTATASYLIYVARLGNYVIMHIQAKGRYVDTPWLHWFCMSLWISIHLARLISLNYLCEKISAKANEMEKIIHQLTESLRHVHVYDEIFQFSLQIICRPLKFTGMGFFYFGYSLLRKFVITITGFMIIVIQISDKTKTEVDF